MGKSSRRISRGSQFRARNGQSSPPAVRGFDPATVKLTDISSVELDTGDNMVTATVQVPIGDGEDYAAWEVPFDFDVEGDGSPELRDAALKLFVALQKDIAGRAWELEEVPCQTCQASCCGRANDEIRLTPEDVQRWIDHGVDVEEHVTQYEAMTFSGHVGRINLVDDERLGGHRCPFSEVNGCSVYEFRPEICHEYSPYTCDIYEADEEKLAGKVHLRVVEGDR